MKHRWILLGLLVLSWHYPRPEAQYLTVAGALGDPLESALRHDRIGFTVEGAFSHIALCDRQALLQTLCRIDRGYNQAREIHLNNLANLRTTKTIGGDPFRCQSPLIASDGTFAGVAESGTDFRWVYEPTHPDAVKEGPKAGYVAQSNVDEAHERRALEQLRAQQLLVWELMRRVQPDILISTLSEASQPALGVKCPTAAAQPPQFPKSGSSFDLHWAMKAPDPTKIGQTSVANALNWLSGSAEYSAATIEKRHGYGLLQALKEESKTFHVDWRDVGDLSETNWPAITETLDQGYPVIVAFNGKAAPSSAGHIVMLLATHGQQVEMFDPWRGETVMWNIASLLEAPPHPDGNFVFLPYPAAGCEDFVRKFTTSS